MSNLIKSRFVYLTDDNKKVIDSNNRNDMFQVIQFNKPLVELSQDETLDDIVSDDHQPFIEGLSYTVIDKVFTEEDNKLLEIQAEQIMADTNEKAAQILEQAKNEAIIACEVLYEEARMNGYKDGLNQSINETVQKEKELEELIQKQREDYLKQIETLEPQFAQVVSSLIEKITGIIVEDKKDVILYLIHNAMNNAENSKAYNIKVSKHDYDFVLSKKDELSSFTNDETIIEIILDKNLNKNQCFIETDTRIIDCSLDVQLNRLIQDIKIISNQKV